MKPMPRPLLAAARAQQGLVTTEDLTRWGVVGRARSTAFDSGQLVPIHRGVYRMASHADSFEQRCLAALLAAPTAALSSRTGARVWDLRKVYTDDVHILARHAIQLEGVSAHRSDMFSERDVVVRKGLRVLRPPRLLCDLAWYLDDQSLESVFEQMLDRRMLTVQAARSIAREFVTSGRPGSARLARVLDSRPGWMKPVDSDQELILWEALQRRGHAYKRQVPVLLDSGITVHIDLALPSIRFGVEVDHVTWHGGRLDTQRDKQRDRGLAKLGWTISRVTDEDIGRRLGEVVTDLEEIARICTARA